MRNNMKKKICCISSSGGHYEQLRMLKVSLEDIYHVTWVTERTKYKADANFYLVQTGSKDIFFIFKMFINAIKSIFLWIKIRPDIVITTGAMIVIPLALLSKLFRKKLIYIETFARIHDGTKTGKLMYKYADLFIVQWEELLKVYPNAVYGGSIY